MNISELLLTVATSTIVSGLVTFLLKTYFKVRIEATYNRQLEKYKSDLLIAVKEQHERIVRRQEGYPKLVEIVYRIRNMARDLESSLLPSSYSLVGELNTRVKELEDSLFKYRIDLERDSLFVGVHEFKNICKNFCWKVGDVKYFLEHQEEERAQHLRSELKELYRSIEENHSAVIHDLSKLRDETKLVDST
jgi:hypothetical protein